MGAELRIPLKEEEKKKQQQQNKRWSNNWRIERKELQRISNELLSTLYKQNYK